jgi:hypothetical protein
VSGEKNKVQVMLSYVFLMFEFLPHRANKSVNRINATVIGSKQAEKEGGVEAEADPAICDADCKEDGGADEATE